MSDTQFKAFNYHLDRVPDFENTIYGILEVRHLFLFKILVPQCCSAAVPQFRVPDIENAPPIQLLSRETADLAMIKED